MCSPTCFVLRWCCVADTRTGRVAFAGGRGSDGGGGGGGGGADPGLTRGWGLDPDAMCIHLDFPGLEAVRPKQQVGSWRQRAGGGGGGG
jgi:hypothetical protein